MTERDERVIALTIQLYRVAPGVTYIPLAPLAIPDWVAATETWQWKLCHEIADQVIRENDQCARSS